jgi:hypothetical protein
MEKLFGEEKTPIEKFESGIFSIFENIILLGFVLAFCFFAFPFLWEALEIIAGIFNVIIWIFEFLSGIVESIISIFNQ